MGTNIPGLLKDWELSRVFEPRLANKNDHYLLTAGGLSIVFGHLGVSFSFLNLQDF